MRTRNEKASETPSTWEPARVDRRSSFWGSTFFGQLLSTASSTSRSSSSASTCRLLQTLAMEEHRTSTPIEATPMPHHPLEHFSRYITILISVLNMFSDAIVPVSIFLFITMLESNIYCICHVYCIIFLDWNMRNYDYIFNRKSLNWSILENMSMCCNG